MCPVIKTRMVFHDISIRCVWRCGDNRAAKAFSINLLFAKYLDVGSWLQCLVCVFIVEHCFLRCVPCDVSMRIRKEPVRTRFSDYSSPNVSFVPLSGFLKSTLRTKQ